MNEFDITIDTGTLNAGGNSAEFRDPLRQGIEDFRNFNDALGRINALESQWNDIKLRAEKARRQRYVDVDIKELRAKNEIGPDETVIPIRSINSTIENELPPYIAYLRTPGRLVAFNNPEVEPHYISLIEKEFTRVAKYDSWEKPFHKLLDCVISHGWGAVEIVYDATRPGHFAIEYVRHEDFLFPKDTIDIQYCDFVIRKYHLTNDQLRFLVKHYEFNPDESAELIKGNPKGNLINVGKLMYRDTNDGFIYVAWYSTKSRDWLRPPQKLFLGVRNKVIDVVNGGISYENVYETDYPFEVLCYHEGEDDRITAHKGRVWLDQYKQEAQTAVWTGFVNRLIRASNVYASPKERTTSDNKPKILSLKLKNGAVYDRPLEFFGLEYPNPLVINVLNALDVRSQAESASIAWAVNNRQDSRKTATELNVAVQQQSLLYSVQLSLFSIFLRHVYTRCWRIVKSEAISGNIDFLKQIRPESRDRVLMYDYVITAAGDEDFVMRQDRINRKTQLLSVMLQTPLGTDFLVSLLKDVLPDEAERWEFEFAKLKAAGDAQVVNIVGGLVQALISISQAFADKFSEDQKRNIISIIDAANAFIAQKTGVKYEQATIQNGVGKPMAEPSNDTGAVAETGEGA